MAHQHVPSYRFDFRHGISNRGVLDRTSPAINGGQVHSFTYQLDDLPLIAGMGRLMPSHIADLIDVSVAVYLADRLALRKVKRDFRFLADRWHRRIHVVIPVRDPEWWQRSEVIAHLQKLLSFLTDDVWSLEFVARTSSPRQAEIQTQLSLPPIGRVSVALNSGGLDSLAGLVELVTIGRSATVVPVTVVTNRQIRRASQSVAAEIRRSLTTTEPQLLPTTLCVSIEDSRRHRNDREPTQRARAMLYMAVGVSSAVIAGEARLQVCENGIGAISLPMTSDHWGAHATRAMHPRTLMLMSELATIVLDRPFNIENIGFFRTKGELVRPLAGSHFVEAARQTVSCDHATYLRRREACGKCTSCFLRRVALAAAGLDGVVDGHALQYRVDWCRSEAECRIDKILHLVAMRHQIERLREAIDEKRGFAALDAAFPDLFDVVTLAPSLGCTESDVETRLLRLYGAYVREFDTFLARIDRIDWGRMASIPAPPNMFEQVALAS